MSAESGCKHCWHSRGSWSDSVGTHESRQCCHCGQFETIDITPRPLHPPSTGGIWIQPKHGPHEPPTQVMW